MGAKESLVDVLGALVLKVDANSGGNNITNKIVGDETVERKAADVIDKAINAVPNGEAGEERNEIDDAPNDELAAKVEGVLPVNGKDGSVFSDETKHGEILAEEAVLQVPNLKRLAGGGGVVAEGEVEEFD